MIRQRARWQQVQSVALVADHDRVTGVVAALVAHDVVDAVTEYVGCLALAFIAPLRADDHNGGHVTGPSRNRTKAPASVIAVGRASAAGALAFRYYRTGLTAESACRQIGQDTVLARTPCWQGHRVDPVRTPESQRRHGCCRPGTPGSESLRRPRRSPRRRRRAGGVRAGIPGSVRAPTGSARGRASRPGAAGRGRGD